MQPYKPRLLAVDAPDVPAHIKVSHDLRVVEEMRDPAVSSVVYVPRWEGEIRYLFNRLAQEPAGAFDTIVHLKGDPTLQEKQRLQFLRAQAVTWLAPLLPECEPEERRELAQGIAVVQNDFIAAIQRYDSTQGRSMTAECYVQNSHELATAGDFAFNPATPAQSVAHIDPFNVALFCHPIGTLLVDQRGEEMAALKHQHRVMGKLPLAPLANRLWQVPDAAFLFMKGGTGDNPQFHVIPHVPLGCTRYRMITMV